MILKGENTISRSTSPVSTQQDLQSVEWIGKAVKVGNTPGWSSSGAAGSKGLVEGGENSLMHPGFREDPGLCQHLLRRAW